MGYEWDKKNKYIFSVGLMRKGDSELVDWLEAKMEEGISRNAIVREALKEKMEKEPKQ